MDQYKILDNHNITSTTENETSEEILRTSLVIHDISYELHQVSFIKVVNFILYLGPSSFINYEKI
jgi:hypothetical protein